jgi:hypothetical protein
LNNRTVELLIKLIKILAVIGFLITFLSLGGRTFGRININRIYPGLVGGILILPYLIYLFSSKSKQKKVLKSNPIDFNTFEINEFDYSERKTKKKIFEIYIFNETAESLIVNRNSLLKPNVWYIFTLTKHKSLYFSNGIEFHLTREFHLETYDHRNQVIGLGGKFLKKYDVPNYVDWAIVISQPNQGDNIE